MKRAVFRADASAAIGGGHVMRCLTLADQLRAEGWDCAFACRSETSPTVPHLASSGFRIVELDGPLDDEPHQMQTAFPAGCDLLIVDHYDWNAALELPCRNWAAQILVIDDLADRPHDCDLLLDQTFGRDPADYAASVPPDCLVLTGSSYALLRAEFSEARQASLDRRRQAPQLGRIIISMGMTDATNATALALDGILESDVSVNIDIILGAGAPHLNKIRSRLPPNAELHVKPDNLVQLIMGADIAIGAAGTSSWERCCLGLPSLLIVTADNQATIARNISSASAAINLGRDVSLQPGKIGDEIKRLSLHPELLTMLSQKAAALCDGVGVRRLIERINASSKPGP